MKLKLTLIILLFVSCICFIFSCRNSQTGSGYNTDSVFISKGKEQFNQLCSGCHNFRTNGIGPNLRGVTADVSPIWLTSFIKNPQEVISTGDKRANELVQKYKTLMPGFGTLPDEDINALLAYMHTFPKTSSSESLVSGLSDPVPEKISMSDLIIDLKEITIFPVTNPKKDTPLTRVTLIRHQPGRERLFACDLNGQLYLLKNGIPQVCMDFNTQRENFIHQPGLGTGFGSFAFHPEFNKNGLLFTSHTEKPGKVIPDFGLTDSIKPIVQWVVTEWKIRQPGANHFDGTSRELFRADMVSGIHGMQEITFNPLAKPGDSDYGNLYIGIGDGGSVEDGYLQLIHRKDRVFGTILRINPAGKNSKNGKYGIPPDNPFLNETNKETIREIFAMGFRNPHRITWTSDGRMLVSNIGQKNIESLYVVRAGDDCGWPVREGSFELFPESDLGNIFNLSPNDSKHNFTYPLAQYDHDEGVAITGGYEYTGSALPALKDKFFFGDIPSGRLFFIDLKDISNGRKASIREWKMKVNGEPKAFTDICGKRVDLHFGRDANGELYLFTKADGKIYKMAAVGKSQN